MNTQAGVSDESAVITWEDHDPSIGTFLVAWKEAVIGKGAKSEVDSAYCGDSESTIREVPGTARRYELSAQEFVEIDPDRRYLVTVCAKNASGVSAGDQIVWQLSSPALSRVPVSVTPNPATVSNGATFSFRMPQDGRVSLKIYDIRGRFMTEILNELRTKNTLETIRWGGLDSVGRRVASGTYGYQLTLNGQRVAHGKLTLLQ